MTKYHLTILNSDMSTNSCSETALEEGVPVGSNQGGDLTKKQVGRSGADPLKPPWANPPPPRAHPRTYAHIFSLHRWSVEAAACPTSANDASTTEADQDAASHFLSALFSLSWPFAILLLLLLVLLMCV